MNWYVEQEYQDGIPSPCWFLRHKICKWIKVEFMDYSKACETCDLYNKPPHVYTYKKVYP